MRTLTLGSPTARRATKPVPALPRLRAPFVYAFFLLLFVGLAGRSLYLQGIDNEFLQEQGSSRYSREIEVPAHRGRIVDRDGEALAVSTPVKSLWAFPGKVEASPAQLAQLAKILELPPQALAKKLAPDSDFAFIARQVPPEVADQAMRLRIKGVYDQNEYRRFYPGGETMSHILGFTGDHDAGQEGLELAQQEWLGGKAGSRRVIINRRGDAVEDVAAIRAPQAGRDLALAIDSRLQYLAFRELKAAIDANKAKAGGLVILDAQSGEVLALANWPTYNPNARNKVAREKMRNRALTDVFEPGSTMKPFTIAAALDAGRIRPETMIETSGGAMTIGSHTIHDAHANGTLSVEQVIQKSSNIGAARIALALPSELMWEMFSDAGFGTPPRTGFPGEVSGRLRPAKSWKPIEQATMAYGHGLSVNLVQLARAYTVFASDGELKPATLLKGNGPVAGKPVLKPETARAVRRMLEMAVQPGGTAPKAQIPGYRVAGKTGTAHKLEGRGYTNRYISSFVGFAPASKPRLVVAVMIDEPSAGQHYGGAVAAPVFSAVTGAALRMLGVPTDAPVNNVLLPPEGSEVREET
ncbi:MAG: penicillin-binding protein 2 [Betaproteobacteria bacterium]|nr:penicillin-binding protein 2 [Betaproteobacteria bacterium]MBK9674460.1 penicillin-binding protein 2 [Betaproteobacteria bacterium]